MARPRTNDTVSLFPFLAVLVCAMGALILLLLVTTRRIRSNAVAHEKASRISERFVEPHDAPSPVQIPDAPLAKSFPPPMPPAQFVPRGMSPRLTQASPSIVARIPAPSPPPIDPDKRWNVQLATLTREHEVEKAQVDGAMAQLSNFLGQAKQLRQSIAEAEQRLQALQSRRQETVTASASTSATAEELQEKIDHATRRLQQLRKQAVTQSTQYTFVAFDGAHGTTRRPILIECSKAGYRFAQEDIGLDEKDFYGFTSEYNPLMAGARALIEYWQIQAGLDQDAPTRGGFRPPSSDKQDKHSAPYVLLIVRPDGAPAYYAARKMLAGLRTTFGYELFEADRDLHAPASDPKATAQCRQAIQEMMRMRRELRQQVLGGQPGSGDPQIRGGQLGNGDQPSGGGQPGRDVVQRLPGGSS
ncbi:MAG: hypothetical protein O3A00_26995, partial [Planctomycetota bacterium]|nr:hypothetical protein [Planctomycetota bacterium]